MGATKIILSNGPLAHVGRWLVRTAVLASAIVLALVISGAIFQVIPGVMIAHARGISMEPAYADGDVVLLRIATPAEVKPGEVVLFQEDGVPVTHRVIEVGPDAGANTVIVTKGDNNPIADKAIKLGAIRGRVIAKLPLLGETSRWLGAGGGFYVYHYAALVLNLIFVLIVAAVSVVRINGQQEPPIAR